jgi:hypothetical protein
MIETTTSVSIEITERSIVDQRKKIIVSGIPVEDIGR